MRTPRMLSLTLALAFLPGCFALEELEAGRAIMEAHTPAAEKRKRAEAEEAKREKPQSYQELVGSWWKDAHTINVSPEQRLAADDPLVPCTHGGKTVYTKRSDCVARGGRAG